MKVIIHTVDGKEHVANDNGAIKKQVESESFINMIGITMSSADGKYSTCVFTKHITAIEFKEE
ncbi:hypothetical protein [Bacillus sp. AFS075034]|uniref:hypothetical protein n=1 Tax=Bacillus sp. AFS075034 TaxID=2034281 RepID=UPI000BF894FD|nr:hypothetical protein [Bacillus sp. AFS075034]PFW61540.1 hypothetical protein COL20_17005 [Bacillus sp. AFS075034]